MIRALDPQTLDRKWEFKMNDITWAGVLTTASDLAFGGGKEGYFPIFEKAVTLAAATPGLKLMLGSGAEGSTYAHGIAVTGDPLADITELQRVKFVMKGGRVFRDDLGAASPR